MTTLEEKLNAINREKRDKLLPENIKKDVTVFGVTGTLEVGEDLSEQLAAQDAVIAELQEAVKNKTAGGGGSTPNIFMQLEEPEIKDGIWIKSDTEYKNIIATQNAISENGEFKNTAVPSYTQMPSCTAMIDSTIYIFCADSDRNRPRTVHKYDISKNTYEQVTKESFLTQGGYSGFSCAAVGTDIYILGGDSYYGGSIRNLNIKFDTIEETFTAMTPIPYEFYNGSAIAIGTDIYILGGQYGKNKYCIYDTLTDSYSDIKYLPAEFIGYSNATAVGTDIYLIGTTVDWHYSGKNTHKLDTTTLTFTRMSDLPDDYSFQYGTTAVIGTDIYLFKEYGLAYKYNYMTDEYIKLEVESPFNSSVNGSISVGTDIYLFGQSSGYIFSNYLVNSIPNSSIVIEQAGNTNKTKLFNNNFGAEYKYTNVYLKEEDGLVNNTTSRYNGNGEEWAKIGGAE